MVKGGGGADEVNRISEPCELFNLMACCNTHVGFVVAEIFARIPTAKLCCGDIMRIVERNVWEP